MTVVTFVSYDGEKHEAPIEEGCSLSGVTVCANARIGAGSNLKEGSCVGRGYHVPPNTNALKGAHFTAGPGAGGGLMDD